MSVIVFTRNQNIDIFILRYILIYLNLQNVDFLFKSSLTFRFNWCNSAHWSCDFNRNIYLVFGDASKLTDKDCRVKFRDIFYGTFLRFSLGIFDNNVQPGMGKFVCVWLEWFALGQGNKRHIFEKCQFPTPSAAFPAPFTVLLFTLIGAFWLIALEVFISTLSMDIKGQKKKFKNDERKAWFEEVTTKLYHVDGENSVQQQKKNIGGFHSDVIKL